MPRTRQPAPLPGTSLPQPHRPGRFVARAFALGLALAGTLFAPFPTRAEPPGWTVDFTPHPDSLRPFRPLHGVNGGPLCYRGTVDLRDRHRELAIPLTRLHDTVWVNAEAVDVHTIFRDFRNNPSDPASYDFRATDDVIRGVQDTGAAVVFRLGESIEHTPHPYWVHPPSDPARWAEVALGIVRHYETAWAGGMTHAVRDWEIWNEPEVRPAMWTGTDAQFLELFELTASRIQQAFPNLRLGGPGFGHVGNWVGDRFEPSPFVLEFLRRCRARALALRFFSWHLYTDDLEAVRRLAVAVRALLDAEGFSGTESHLTEWNYLPDRDWSPMTRQGQGPARAACFRRMNGPEGAAFSAAVLLQLQDLPVDAAAYFSGEVQGFGLFDFHGTPKPTFHAFRAFRDLLRTPLRARVQDPPPAPAAGNSAARWVAAAGRNAEGTAATFLVAAHAPAEARPGMTEATLRVLGLPWTGPTRWERRRVGTGLDPEQSVSGQTSAPEPSIPFDLPSPGLVLIRLERAGDSPPDPAPTPR